jgi:membrane protease YdiL (CAAX protease family)
MSLTDLLASAAGIALVCVPFFWCRARDEAPESYGLSWSLTRGNAAECAAVTLIVLAVLTVAATHWPGENLPRHSGWKRTLDLAVSGLSAAIIEEIFFRGWVYPMFRKKFRVLLSVVFTSAIFAMAHVFVASAPFMFAVFFPGCVMALLRERHGNIATSTLFHASCNIWAIWFVPARFPSVSEWMRILGV